MKVKKTRANVYEVELNEHEKKSLYHCALLANESTDNLLVHAFTAAIALVVLLSQLKETYDKISN